MIDYEPQSNYSLAHAEAYAAFVKSLASALHANDQTLEMCVSSWSILSAHYSASAAERGDKGHRARQ